MADYTTPDALAGVLGVAPDSPRVIGAVAAANALVAEWTPQAPDPAGVVTPAPAGPVTAQVALELAQSLYRRHAAGGGAVDYDALVARLPADVVRPLRDELDAVTGQWGLGVIAATALEYATALRRWFPTSSGVTVYDTPPDAPAGPCVVLAPVESVSYEAGTYRIGHMARCLAGDGAAVGPATLTTRELADRALAAAASVAAPAQVRVSPGVLRIGDIGYPTVDVTATFVARNCDLPPAPEP